MNATDSVHQTAGGFFLEHKNHLHDPPNML